MTDGNADTSRNKPVTIYYTEEEKEAIKREADAAGKTVSGYCRELVDRQRRADDLEQLDAEARLERVMAEGTDRVNELAEDIRQQNGAILGVLRDLENQLEGVDLDDQEATGDADDGEQTNSGKVDDVEELL